MKLAATALRCALLCALLAACGTTPTTSPLSKTASPLPNLGVANGTTLTVTLFVNGRSVADVPPGGSESSVSDTVLPPMPWTVEARTSSGRVLATAFAGTAAAGSGQSGRYDFDLTCGRLTIWMGETLPPAPALSGSAGTPGDCAP